MQDLWLEKLVAGLQDSWKLGLFMRGHTHCLWSADGQTNRGGVSPQGFRTVSMCGGL